jgi:hypothetical protein
VRLPRHKASLRLTHNEHRSYYESPADFIEGREQLTGLELEWAAPGQKEKAIVEDSIWHLQWYPQTPIGFYDLYAADLDVLLDAAMKVDAETWTED